MSLYQVKHKARGQYGVIDEEGQWLDGFIGSKQQANEKIASLNRKSKSTHNKSNVLTAKRKHIFTLTEQGWLYKGA